MGLDTGRAKKYQEGTDIKHSLPASSGKEYNLSFVESILNLPKKQIKEALEVLLSNRITENQTNESNRVQKESKKLAEQEAAQIRWLLAINPNTPPPVLDHLSKEPSAQLLERIAEHPRSNSTTLSRLATHNDAQVRAALAENSNLSIKTIWKLARDQSADVRYRLAESYTVPLAVLRILTEDENPYVVSRAQYTLKRILDEVSALRLRSA